MYCAEGNINSDSSGEGGEVENKNEILLEGKGKIRYFLLLSSVRVDCSNEQEPGSVATSTQ